MTDTVQALEEFSWQLKPGGTLVMTYYTRPRIVNNAHAQSIWEEIFQGFVKRYTGPIFDRAYQTGGSALDSIAIPPTRWTAIKRIYINAYPSTGSFRMGNWAAEDRVGSDEERIWISDPDWCLEQGVNWLKKYLATWAPIFESESQELWDELERVADADKFWMEVPVVMVFATKRAN
ncbi:hypothetical protein F5Y03DRAFT_17681 [Xylaria venustula]|nr:hypothetical protein F5Y03DRAFT_17681 [Xylaria venustula]